MIANAEMRKDRRVPNFLLGKCSAIVHDNAMDFHNRNELQATLSEDVIKNHKARLVLCVSLSGLFAWCLLQSGIRRKNGECITRICLPIVLRHCYVQGMHSVQVGRDLTPVIL